MRYRPLLLLLLVLGLFCIPASADAIWTPEGMNDYYDGLYISSPIDVYQDYQVPDHSTATIYESPEDGGVLKVLASGETIFITHKIEQKDTVWGIGNANGTVGWVRLNRLQKIYSHEDFLEDYDPDIQHHVSERIDVSKITEPIYTWTYPGSGIIDVVLHPDGFSTKYYHEGKLPYWKIYTDPNGDQWGYVGYFLVNCGWIYLEDLHNPNPDFRLDPVVENTVTDTSSAEEEPHRSLFGSVFWAVILIALVCAVTALTIYTVKHY